MNAIFSIFPKYYKHLSVEQLAELVREAGLDTTDLVIRDGYWVTPANLATEVPAFVRAMERAGLEIRFATAGYMPRELAADPAPLAVLADNGITEFRMGYFKAPADARAALDDARDQMETMAALCERHRIRAVLQVHQGTLLPNASAAYPVFRGLPARWVGVMLDPGNQTFEGFENWGRSARLLGEYLVAVGIKDSVPLRDPARASEPGKGWTREWAPLDEGVINWYDVIRALDEIRFDGTFGWMPFYDIDHPAEMTRKLQREVAYLRAVIASVEQESGARPAP